MKVVVAPGSFKGSIHSLGAANAISRALREMLPKAGVKKLILADGGEGTLEAFVANFGTKLVSDWTTDPFGRPIKARYVIGGDFALLQSSESVGISLLRHVGLDPIAATSCGLGRQVIQAAKRGARRILVGMGDSAVLDFGLGMMAAVGCRWLDRQGLPLEPLLKNGSKIGGIDMSNVDPILGGIEFVALYDTNDYFSGPTGQVVLYGEQKGLAANQVADVDGIFSSFASFVLGRFGIDLVTTAGSSGSGGIAGTMHALLDADLVSTLEYLDERLHIRESIRNGDIVITGEGRLDLQSKYGKVPYFVAESVEGTCFHVVGSVTKEGARDVGGLAAQTRFVFLNPGLPPRQAFREAAEGIANELDRWGNGVGP